jgi:hypothetical protein
MQVHETLIFTPNTNVHKTVFPKQFSRLLGWTQMEDVLEQAPEVITCT